MRRNRHAALGLALLALAALSGCGTSPASAPTTEIKNPSFVRTAPPRDERPGAQIYGATSDAPTSTSAVIDGSVGGTLQLREFRLDVPKGAFEGSATITMNLPDPSIYQVDLHIDPPAANHFEVPVVLTATLPTRTDAMADEFLWYDGSVEAWRVIPTTRNVNTITVATPLTHFSLYGIIDYVLGKAGW